MSAKIYVLYNSRNMLKTLQYYVYSKIQLSIRRTFLTFILSKRDVNASMTSNYEYDVI